MLPRTRFLGRLFGLYCILVSLSMLIHRQATVDAVTALMHNPPLLLLTGVITVFGGLAVVLGHNIWSGGAVPVVVSLFGWIILLKGLLILFLTPDAADALFLGGFRYSQLFYVYACFSLIVGIYLNIALTLQSRTGRSN